MSVEKAQKTNDLVWTYNNLSDAIANSKGNTELLAIQQGKLAEVTEELQKLHPDTITQYDIETGKARERVNLLKEETDAERELKKLRLEKTVSDSKKELPSLEKEMESLGKQTTELQNQRDAIGEAIPALKQFQVEYEKIQQMDYTEEALNKLVDLRERTDSIAQTVGFNFNGVPDLDKLGSAIADLENIENNVLGKLVAKTDELNTATDSYQELYDQQVELINLNFDGKLMDQIQNYKDLSVAERERTDKGLQAISELHKSMDMLPTDKQINIDVLWRQIGNPLSTTQQLKTFDMPQYADGGYADQPSIFGEAGPEMAIPLRKDQRSRDLHAMTGRMLGIDSGSTGNFAPVYRPQIFIQGNANEQTVRKVVSNAQKEWELHLHEYERKRQRVGLAGR